MWLLRVINLFTFSHDGHQNQQGGRVTLMWLAALSSVNQRFDVARYFEEILLDLEVRIANYMQ